MTWAELMGLRWAFRRWRLKPYYRAERAIMNQAFQLGLPDNLARQVAVYATRVSARRGLVFKEVDATVALVGRYVAMVHEGKSVDEAGKYVMEQMLEKSGGAVAADFLSILTEDGTYTPPGMRRPVRVS